MGFWEHPGGSQVLLKGSAGVWVCLGSSGRPQGVPGVPENVWGSGCFALQASL